jgi:protein gp37
MAEKSAIQWTDATWNIARGCTKVDEDCKYCYMYRESMGSTRYNPLEIIRTKTVFTLPLKIKEPSKIFTSSLTDFFHEAIDDYRNEAWDIIRKCPQHTFQILTKRPERISGHLPEDWGNGWNNVWLGTSVGSSNGINRIRDLIEMKGRAKVLFLSLEPLHGYVDLSEYYFPYRLIKYVPEHHRTHLIDLIDWVIVGGESGNENGKYRYRPCDLEWIQDIVSTCKKKDVPVFVKQLGTHLSKQLGMSDRHGGNIDDFPKNLQIREFPKS